MKIAVIGFANLRLLPYYNTYKAILDDNKMKYEVIYWDRKCEDDSLEDTNLHPIQIMMDDEWPVFKKFIQMIKFSKKVKQILKSNKYDKVIVLTTLPAIFLYRYLLHNYKGKYIFDNRDYSYENIRLFKYLEGNIMKNSCLNVISSPAFRHFIPDYPTVICHNCNYNMVGNYKLIKKDKVIISFIGMIRYADECKKILTAIRNDKRVELRFYGEGEGARPLKAFCETKNIQNVSFYGRYYPADKEDIIKGTDIIYNCYGNQSMEVKYALSNKYYDALFYKKPLLVNQKTSMEEYSKGISFSFAENKGEYFVDDLYEWYMNINESQFQTICNEKINTVLKENERFVEEVLKVLKE